MNYFILGASVVGTVLAIKRTRREARAQVAKMLRRGLTVTVQDGDERAIDLAKL